MPEIEVPVREEQKTYRCRCVYRHEVDGVWVDRDRCKRSTSGPDDPFCYDCEDRHTEIDQTHVGVWTGS